MQIVRISVAMNAANLLGIACAFFFYFVFGDCIDRISCVDAYKCTWIACECEINGENAAQFLFSALSHWCCGQSGRVSVSLAVLHACGHYWSTSRLWHPSRCSSRSPLFRLFMGSSARASEESGFTVECRIPAAAAHSLQRKSLDFIIARQ